MIQKALSAFFVLWLAVPVSAQVRGLDNSKTPPPAQQEAATDPLGRSTPRGTIIAFTGAVHRDDFVSAGRYLQITAKTRGSEETLARNLNDLMDRYYHRPVTAISEAPDGDLFDGLPLDREGVGPLEIRGKDVYIELVRVKDPEAGQIWLISSETLAKVPDLHRAIDKTFIERVMPEALQGTTVLGVSLAQLVVLAASIGVPIFLLWLLSLVSIVLLRKVRDDPAWRRRVATWDGGIRWPAILTLALSIHVVSLAVLGFSLRFRITYSRAVGVLLILSTLWLIRRLLTLSFDYVCSKMQGRKQTGRRSMMLLAERLLKALTIILAVFVCLLVLGVDVKTSLAGLGIVGIALAVGAQKTVENLLGGFFLLSDRALAVGDTCLIANRLGVVEDVTLRSIRLRTTEQTLLSVPAGVLSQESIDNYSARNKILMKVTLRLRYGTSSEQLKVILERIRSLLAERDQIETSTSRVRLVDFGARAIEFELFGYVLTSDYSEYLSVREDLLLQISGIVEASGASFASPEKLELIGESTRTRETERVA